jgi:hypothetical protein
MALSNGPETTIIDHRAWPAIRSNEVLMRNDPSAQNGPANVVSLKNSHEIISRTTPFRRSSVTLSV